MFSSMRELFQKLIPSKNSLLYADTLYPLALFLPIPDVELLVSDVKEKLMMSCQHGAVLIGLHHGECRQGTQLDASTTFVGRQFHRANFAFLLKKNEFGGRVDGKGFVASSFQAEEGMRRERKGEKESWKESG